MAVWRYPKSSEG